jgi:hypothetical protein
MSKITRFGAAVQMKQTPKSRGNGPSFSTQSGDRSILLFYTICRYWGPKEAFRDQVEKDEK